MKTKFAPTAAQVRANLFWGKSQYILITSTPEQPKPQVATAGMPPMVHRFRENQFRQACRPTARLRRIPLDHLTPRCHKELRRNAAELAEFHENTQRVLKQRLTAQRLKTPSASQRQI